jgi:hypothetical protein
MALDPFLDEQLFPHRELIKDLLAPGEEIRWIGQPLPSRFVRHGWIVVMFACLWLGGAGLGFWSQLKDLPYGVTDPDFPQVACIFLPAMILGTFLVTKPMRDVSRALRIVYLVTNVRALIIYTGRRPRMYQFDEGVSLMVKPETDGSGDILFSGSEHPVRVARFLGVPEVDKVATLLRTLQPASLISK